MDSISTAIFFWFWDVYIKGTGNRESGIGNRESGIGNRESGIGNRESGIGNREEYGAGARVLWNFSYNFCLISCIDMHPILVVQ